MVAPIFTRGESVIHLKGDIRRAVTFVCSMSKSMATIVNSDDVIECVSIHELIKGDTDETGNEHEQERNDRASGGENTFHIGNINIWDNRPAACF